MLKFYFLQKLTVFEYIEIKNWPYYIFMEILHNKTKCKQ